VAITLGARKEGVTPRQFVDKYHNLMKKAFEDFGISFDIYSRTSNPVHYELSQELFKNIYDKNGFIEETSDQYFDEQENIFLADRYIIGTCPNCSNPNAYGDQCEKCGTSLSPKQLINPRSTVSGKAPVLRPTKHWYFPLDRFEGWLKEWLLEGHKDWKTNVYGQCRSWIEQGLQPRSITRDLDWGIPVPLPDAKGKVLYVWFDAPIGYISATKELRPNDWEKYWKDPETRLLHFIGKDNIVFHCIIFPCILKATGEYIVPDNVPANEFLNLEGEKLSTSRNHAVWLHEYLEQLPNRQDELRYVLTSISPETKDSDFTWKDYQARVNNELVGNLGGFIHRTLTLVNTYFGGKVPPNNSASLKSKVDDVYRKVKEFQGSVESSIEGFQFREGLAEVMNISRIGNVFLSETKPWERYKQDAVLHRETIESVLHTCLQLVAKLSIVMEPYLPRKAAQLKQLIGGGSLSLGWNDLGKDTLLPVGHQINKAEHLFAKIDDETIEKQIARLKKPIVETPKDAASLKPLKPEIVFDDFAKLDIRVGKVIECVKMEKSDKLLKLTIDSGIDTRTILSGIAKHYSPEDLIGKQVTFIANLAPRKMMGIESQGMILSAEDVDGKLKLIRPIDDVTPGAAVS
jgi:methionyl-tRNA synthetase